VTDGPAGTALRPAVLRGVAWKVLSQVFFQGSRLVVTVILARLLSPGDYGLAAMVLVFASLVLIFSDLALGSALVQRQEIDEDDRSTAFWTSMAAGALFTLLGVALAGTAAAFYGAPEVKPLFVVFSLSFVVTAAGATQSALLTRTMDFRSLELRQMGGILVGAVAGISLAALGFGPWAIIGQQLAIATVSTVLLWTLSDWRPRFLFSMRSLRSLGSFSANVFGTRLLFYGNRNIDNLLIARFLGAAPLGVYSIAYTVMLAPFSQIAGPITEVLLPAFARLQDDPVRLGAAWIRVNRVVAAISMPALLGLVVVAPDFVHVVLGAKWAPAVPVIQILAWVGLLQSLQRLNSSILQARDWTRQLFRYSVIVLVASVSGFVVGLHWGIVGVATGYAISSTLVEPYYTWLTARSVGMPLRRFLASLSGIATASVGMVAVVLPVRLLLVHAGIGAPVRLTLVVLLGVAVFAPLCMWREAAVAQEVRRALRDVSRLRGSGPTAAEPA
jgi:O-antigen/teichoic acid export membrane protein